MVPMSAVWVCSSSLRPVTVTSSVTAPTLNCRSTCARVCTLSCTFARTVRRKPCSSAATSYTPTRRPGKMYSPFVLVTDEDSTPVPCCVAVTVTPGSTPPLASVTRPTIVPVSICAKAEELTVRIVKANRQTRARRNGITEPPNAGSICRTLRVLRPSPCPRKLLAQRIDTPFSGSNCCEIQEDKTIQSRELASIRDRPEALREVSLKIRDGHFT